jgi:hypothetical protein
VKVKKLPELDNQQPSPVVGEGSTTIPKGSTGTNCTGKRPVYLRKRNVIYRITNTVTGKFYIGSASWYDKRIGTHVARLRRNQHDNPHLQAAWNKYGEGSFSFEIVEEIKNESDLVEREQYWIINSGCLDPNIGYNINPIAGTTKGRRMPEDAKRKIGDFWRGKRFDSERIGRLRRDRTIAQGRSVYVYDKSMNLLHEFSSMSDCARKLGISISTISIQCSKRSGNIRAKKDSLYIFRYKDIV